MVDVKNVTPWNQQQEFPSSLGAASTSEGAFHMYTQGDLPTVLPILELRVSEASSRAPQLWDTAAVPVTPWERCCKLGTFTSSRHSHFSTQHNQHQPENSPNSIMRDYLIPDKDSLEALKASSAWKPQTAVTALCERQLDLEMSWGTTPLFHFILIVFSLCKRPLSFHSRNKCDQENNNWLNSPFYTFITQV